MCTHNSKLHHFPKLGTKQSHSNEKWQAVCNNYMIVYLGTTQLSKPQWHENKPVYQAWNCSSCEFQDRPVAINWQWSLTASVGASTVHVTSEILIYYAQKKCSIHCLWILKPSSKTKRQDKNIHQVRILFVFKTACTSQITQPVSIMKTNNDQILKCIFFIVAPCILKFILFIHQKTHYLLNL
jgi:hypothetical protein